MSVIIKVQRPVISTDPRQPWVLYDEHNNHVETVPGDAIPEYVKKMMGDDHKMYCKASWSSTVGWGIVPKSRVGRQEW